MDSTWSPHCRSTKPSNELSKRRSSSGALGILAVTTAVGFCRDRGGALGIERVHTSAVEGLSIGK